MNQAEANKQLVAEFFEAMNRGDTEALLDAYADDGAVQTMGHTLISGRRGKAEIRAFADGVYDAFPGGISFLVNSIIAEGDRVAVEAESVGEHVSGQTYNNQYVFLFTLRDGRIVELKEYLDTEMVTDVLCGGQRPG